MTVIYVYLDNKLIYSRGQDVTKRHGMYGNQLCTVELPKNVWEHTIKVVAKQMETDNSNHSTLFRIMKLKDAVDYPLANNSVFLHAVFYSNNRFTADFYQFSGIICGKETINGKRNRNCFNYNEYFIVAARQ